MHRFTLRVRYADTDQMGWAYHGHYFRWFEIGRAEMLRSLGRSYREMEDDLGLRLPLRDARCRYLVGARYDDVVVIETGIAARSRVGLTFAYRLSPESGGAPYAMGRTEHFFMDRNGRPVRPGAEVETLLAKAPAADAALLEALERT
jgi:acyl-CoA thioester hydrolase